MVKSGFVGIRRGNRLQFECYIFKAGNLECFPQSLHGEFVVCVTLGANEPDGPAHNRARDTPVKLLLSIFAQVT